MSDVRKLAVTLLRPTRYDDEGYLVRHLRGVLPSNTLACLHALTRDAAERGVLGAVQVVVRLCDESVQAVPFRRIAREARRRDTRALVALVGVQTNQMARAADLAHRLRSQGAQVLLGGFHVSGVCALFPELPDDLRRLLDAGITLVTGEVEATWESILRDALRDRLAPKYDTLHARPAITAAPVPRLDGRLLRRFVHRRFATLETSRGCPFTCSFCTVINVQGRTMRARNPALLEAALLESHRTLGTTEYFFTDDDFARNPRWHEVLATLIRVRESHGLPLRFLMQADLRAHRIPGFVDLARRAGCFQVFLGMETLDDESLAAARKAQNRSAEYADVVGAWRRAGVLVHVGYIIGFASDTPERVGRAVRRLRDDVRPDLASFFMLTPLPGSRDHRAHVRAGTALDADWNRYDTTHAVHDHPRMSRAEWRAAYEEAWNAFYAPRAMARQLATVAPELRVTLLQLYLWYRSAVAVEGAHPMMSGFVRLKPRADRRSGERVEGRLAHVLRRGPEMWRTLSGYAHLLAELKTLAAAGTVTTSWPRFLDVMFRQPVPRPAPIARPSATSTTTARQPYANASPTAS